MDKKKMVKKQVNNKNNKFKSRANWRNLFLRITLCLVLSFTVFGFLVLLFRGYVGNDISGPSLWDYQSYLEEKYGKDENFYYVKGGGCPWLENGFCTMVFSSEKVGGQEFEVIASKNHKDLSGTHFNDKYALAKYYDEVDEYYGGFLREIIGSEGLNLEYEIVGDLSKINAKTTFDDLVAQYAFKIGIEVNNSNIDSANLDAIEANIEKIMNERAIDNLESITLYVISDDGQIIHTIFFSAHSL